MGELFCLESRISRLEQRAIRRIFNLENKIERIEAALSSPNIGYMTDIHTHILKSMPLNEIMNRTEIKFPEWAKERTQRKYMQCLCQYGYVMKLSDGKWAKYTKIKDYGDEL